MAVQRIKFHGFEFRGDAEELFRDGAKIELQPKPAAILNMLLQRPGQLVTRDEIAARIWPDRTVDFDQRISTSIKQIRKALDDDPANPVFIETLPRKGYRFIAPIETGEADSALAANVAHPWVQQLVWLGLFGVVAAAIIIFGISRSDSGVDADLNARPLLLISPIEIAGEDSLGADLAEGLWNEMITTASLTAPDELGVIAKPTARKIANDPSLINAAGSEFKIDYQLRTILSERNGKQFVAVSLADLGEGKFLWEKEYQRNRNEFFEIKNDIARSIASALNIKLGVAPRALNAALEIDPEAYSAYLTGRHLLGRGGRDAIERSRAYFEDAILRAPDFSLAYVGLAEAAYRLSNRIEARAAAQKAVELNPDAAAAHYVMARIYLYWDWDWQSAQIAFQRAVALDPGRADLRLEYGRYLIALGEFDGGVAQARLARALDPLSGGINGQLGWFYINSRAPEKAIKECERAIAVHPENLYENLVIHDCLIFANRLNGDMGAAVSHADNLMQIFAAETPALAVSLTDANPNENYRTYLKWRVEAMNKVYPGALMDLAITKVALDDHEGAINIINQAFEKRQGWLVFLQSNPSFDPIRDDARFQEIVAALGMPGVGVTN